MSPPAERGHRPGETFRGATGLVVALDDVLVLVAAELDQLENAAVH